MRSLSRRFHAWLDMIEPGARDAMVSPSTWFGVSCCAALVISAAGLVPATSRYFQLHAGVAAGVFAPTLALGVATGLRQQRNRLSLTEFGVAITCGSALFQAFMWSLVAQSEMPGAILMACLPIFLAAYHGHMFRAGPRNPYIVLGTGFGVLLAFLWNRDPAHLAIYGVAAPIAAGMSLVLGHIGEGNHQARVRSDAMHAALDAQLLREQTQQMARVSRVLLKLQTTNHDAGSALSSVLFSLEQLAVEAHRLGREEPRANELSEIASRLVSSLERLRSLLEEARHTGTESRPSIDYVNLREVVRATVDELRDRLAPAQVHLVDSVAAQGMAAGGGSVRFVVPLYGGRLVAHRILTNLLMNAAEGNGSERAANIWIELIADGSEGTVTVRLRDDGPGFSATMIEFPVRAFHSTKSGGTGLGLYTVAQLLEANNGQLHIGNREPGPGAAVDAVFRETIEHGLSSH